MTENKTRLAVAIVLLLALMFVVVFSLRGTNQATPISTVDSGEIQTAAVQTFAVGLTQTAEVVPTKTPTATRRPTGTPQATAVISATPSCARLLFIKDVTIPDKTSMTPGQSFTKTWLVENNGTCAWQNDFTFSWFGGDAMSRQNVALNQTVEPGQRIELSVPMIAPKDQSGIVKSTWRMADADGNYFGDALTVVIDLGGTVATETASP